MERTNALYAELPELVDVVTIDAGWTRQQKIIPKALTFIKPGGVVVTLVKPHYEALPGQLVAGRVPDELVSQVLAKVKSDLAALGLHVKSETESPIVGEKGRNREFLFFISPAGN
jgi:23S rRNA (cytidine1920-2'-O)/16S rRNA (cytidine1409-2'-O)-methyltransferase